jgi:multicomponent Na+:H+ antiporter subunit C
VEILTALTAGVLVAAAAYLLTGPRLMHLVLGAALLGHGVNLAIFAAGGLHRAGIPIAAADAGGLDPSVADPLPQALVLTAIVIGFGVLGFLVALSYRVQALGSGDEIDQLSQAETRS